jgi:hypothetical protein
MIEFRTLFVRIVVQPMLYVYIPNGNDRKARQDLQFRLMLSISIPALSSGQLCTNVAR